MAVATTGGVPAQGTIRTELDETAATLAEAERTAGDLLLRLRGPQPPLASSHPIEREPGHDCVRTATSTIRASANRLATALREIDSLIG